MPNGVQHDSITWCGENIHTVMCSTACMCIKSIIILTYTGIPCAGLTAPANGAINLDLPAKTVTYTCNTGYDLIGNAMRTCMLGGAWTGTDPTCMGKKFTIYITLQKN